MYSLERISLHNWYLFEALDIDISGPTALIGETGAGKSALIDAIQTVMSGNNKNIIRLNSAADASRSDRKVRDYCLGCVSDVNDGAPTRRRSETTVALTCRHTETGHRIAFGLLLSADADDQSPETTKRFILRGHGFSIDEFLERSAQGAEFMPTHQELLARMTQRFGKALTMHSNGNSFVAEFLTAMRPKASPDPKRFLRTFSNALAVRKLEDPTDFVRRFVLEASPLNVERIRESITTWRELQQETERLEKMLQAAKDVRSRFGRWARHRLEGETQQFLTAHLEKLQLELKIKNTEREQKAFEDQERSCLAEVSGLNDAVKRLRDRIERDLTLAGSTDAATRGVVLDTELRAEHRRMQMLASSLDGNLGSYAKMVQLGRVAQFLPAYARSGVEAASAIATSRSNGKPEDGAGDPLEVRKRIDQVRTLLAAEQSLRPQLEAAAADLAILRPEAARLEGQLAAAGQGGSMLSPATLEFRAELGRRGIQAALLPDVVDVSDPEWAFALESLLGPHREALIVPEEQVGQAFDLLYQHRKRFDGCRLVDTRKTREADRLSLKKGSIAEIVVTDDPHARAFIEHHVGRYIKVENDADLGRMANGILRNGKTTSGLSLRVFRDREPILGRTAREASLHTARVRQAEISSQLLEREEAHRLLAGALKLITQLQDAVMPEEIEDLARQLEDARQRVIQLKLDIAALPQLDQTDLMRQVDEHKAEIRKCEDAAEKARAKASYAHGEARALQTSIEDAKGRSAKLVQREAILATAQLNDEYRRLAEVVGFTDTIQVARERVEALLGGDWKGQEQEKLNQNQRDAAQASTRALEAMDRTLREANKAWSDFLVEWVGQNPLTGEAGDTDKLFWIDARVKRLENNELLPHKGRVVEARDEMERMLKEDLLAKLAEQFETVRVQIDTLNRRLAGHVFVGQRYSFHRRLNERLKPIYDLARQVGENPQFDLMGIQSAGSSPDSRKAFEEIERILNTQEDTREIEDYRNYFTFELFIQNGTEAPREYSKKQGVLSGGQKQAPFYVAIAASMTSVYFPGAKTGEASGLGLVLFDEAFDKLDIKNTVALFELFRSLGLQPVVAAPERHRSTFLECVETIVTVGRMPNTLVSHVDCERIGPRARREMQEQNPEYRGLEAFRPSGTPLGDAAGLAS